jgi:sugar lactone lactonase YvrE
VSGSESFGSLTRGPDSQLYVLSNTLGYGDVQRIDPASGQVQSLLLGSPPDFSKTGLTIPEGIAFDSQGRLYVGSNAWGTPPFGVTAVMRYDAVARRLDPVITPATGGEFITPLRFAPDGTLYVRVGAAVRRYDLTTGADLGAVDPPPVTGATGPDGMLYAANAQKGISRYEPDGTLLGQFVAPGTGGLADVTDLTFGGDGFLYVNSQQASAVLRYRADTGAFVDRFIDYSSVPNGIIWEIEAIAVPEPQAWVGAAGGVMVLALARPRPRRS